MKKAKAKNKWSAKVTKESHALSLDHDVFTWEDPAKIARSLKASARKSANRKTDPYRSAMSMLNFYINRAGKNLPKERKVVLNDAKAELRKQFDRE